MQPTRLEILQILKRQGQATVEGLARELGITLMAVRLHLVVLERDHMVSRSSLRMGPGRPTLIYRLTADAEEVFPKAYDELAAELLAALRRVGGSAAVESICLEAAAGLAQNLREGLAGNNLEQVVNGYTQAMAQKGYLLEVEQADNGYFLNSYSCPFYRVARLHREVCVLHRNMLREALNADVQTITCQLDGDLRCSHMVRVPAAVEALSEPESETVRVHAS
jgi:predicted ArsR family transcriptional regulator